MTHIYEDYINSLQLLPEDREELKKKRGFTDEIIDKYKLKSLIPEDQERIINNLVVRHGEDDVRKAGLIDKSGNIAYALTRKNIIIPYLDKDGKCIYLRAHKNGLPDIQTQLYCPYLVQVDRKSSQIVLTEGEFKALALRQWNITGLGLQGISTWTGGKFHDLVKYLREIQTDKQDFEVVILFDTEDKNNPEHPKYNDCKNKPFSKYPNEFWAYILCYKLHKEGFNCKIATLPSEWMVAGKIDLDMALAQGRTEKDIKRVIEHSKSYSSYLLSLNGECKSIVNRQVEHYFYNFDEPLREEFNRYMWITRDKEGIEVKTPISNFTITLENTIENASMVRSRIITFHTSQGTSRPVEISTKEMTSTTEFKNFCSKVGDYIWTGKQSQLDKLWERLFITSSGSIIYKPDEIGKIDKDWLWGDCVVWGNGEIQKLENCIAQLGLLGYKMPEERSGLPRILTNDMLDIPKLLDLLKKNLQYKSFLGIGWLVCTLMSDVIYELERCFPMLFLFGKRQSGKNVYGRWLTRLAGFDTEGKSFHTSTPKGVIRSLSKLSNLPFWLNEYRNACKEFKKEFLLSIYCREGYVRAETSNDSRTVDQDIKGTLILSGQETPKDNGIFSRCLILQFSERERDDRYFEDINKLWDILPSFSLQVLLNQEKLQQEYFTIYPQIKKMLATVTKHDPRLTTNYSIVTAGFLALAKVFNYPLNIEEFMGYVCQHCRENKITKDMESEVGEFWELVEVVLSKLSIPEDIYLVEEGKIYIWFPTLYGHFAEYYKKIHNTTPFKEGVLRDYLRDEDYYIAVTKKRLSGEARNCIVLDQAKFKDAGYTFFKEEL